MSRAARRHAVAGEPTIAKWVKVLAFTSGVVRGCAPNCVNVLCLEHCAGGASRLPRPGGGGYQHDVGSYTAKEVFGKFNKTQGCNSQSKRPITEVQLWLRLGTNRQAPAASRAPGGSAPVCPLHIVGGFHVVSAAIFCAHTPAATLRRASGPSFKVSRHAPRANFGLPEQARD